MKTKQLVKEANIGSVVELSNVELTIIKTKWQRITTGLSNQRKLPSDLVEDISHFSGLMDKLCGENVLSLEEVANDLFASSPINDDEMQEIMEASTSSYEGMEDEERAERRMDGSTDI